MVEGNPEELHLKLYELYNTKVLQANKKTRATNTDIIEYIKIMYGLYVNGSMISYVRKDKGLQKKRNDSRTVDIEHVNRKPVNHVIKQ